MVFAYLAVILGGIGLYLSLSGIQVPEWLNSTAVIWGELAAVIWGFGYFVFWRPFVRHEELTKRLEIYETIRRKRDSLGNHIMEIGGTIEKIRLTDARALETSGLIEAARKQMGDLAETLAVHFEKTDYAIVMDSSTMQRTPISARELNNGGQRARNKQDLLDQLSYAVENIKKLAERTTYPLPPAPPS